MLNQIVILKVKKKRKKNFLLNLGADAKFYSSFSKTFITESKYV